MSTTLLRCRAFFTTSLWRNRLRRGLDRLSLVPQVHGPELNDHLGACTLPLTFIGFNLCFCPQHLDWLMGMPRAWLSTNPQFPC